LNEYKILIFAYSNNRRLYVDFVRWRRGCC